MHRYLMIAGLLLLAACGGDPGPTGASSESDEFLADSAQDVVTFFNTYPLPADITGSVPWRRFRVYKPEQGVIAVDYLPLNDPAGARNLLRVGIDGSELEAVGTLGYASLDELPSAWFEGGLSHLVRRGPGGYLVPAVLPAAVNELVLLTYDGPTTTGTVVDTTVVLTADAGTGESIKAYVTPFGMVGADLEALSGGGYVLAAVVEDDDNPFGFGSLMRVVRLRDDLSVEWTTDVRATFIPEEQVVVRGTDDGGVLVAGGVVSGSTSYGATDGDAFLFRLHSNGNLAWSQTVTYDTDHREEIIRLEEKTDGSILAVLTQAGVAGSTGMDPALVTPEADYRLVLFSATGSQMLSVHLAASSWHQVTDISVRSNGKYVLTGTILSSYYDGLALFVANVDAGFQYTQSNILP